MVIGALSQDIRYAVRGFARSPGFTAAALLVLALGAGANTAIFSITNAVLLRPLPFREPARLVAIWESAKTFDPKVPISPRDLGAWRSHNRSFESLAGYRVWEYSWTGISDAQKITGEIVTLDFFATLGVSAARGRLFDARDMKGPAGVVISDAFWKTQLGGAEDVLGRSLILDGTAHTIIGVMPPGFQFQPPRAILWTLFTPSCEYYRLCTPLMHGFVLFGRMRPRVTTAAARSDLLRIRRALEATEPEFITDAGVSVTPLQEDLDAMEGDLRPALLTLFAAVLFVLLIACANVASLMLGRASERQKEIALRAALGCGRWRMMRHMLTESLLLSTTGTALGAILAWGGLYWFRRAAPFPLPAGADVRVDLPVLLFTVSLALGTGIVFGFLPAFKASLLDLTGVLRESGRSSRGLRSQRARSLLVVTEVALSLMLLAAAGLVIESFVRLRTEPLGFRTDHVVRMAVDFPERVYSKPEQRLALLERILDRLRRLPGVEPAFTCSAVREILLVEGRPMPASPSAYVMIDGEFITSAYFHILGVPLLRGRYPDERDAEQGEKVAVVNQELARRYFGGEDPIGQRIAFGEPSDHTAWMKIVGIVGSTRRISIFNDMEWETAAMAFVPLHQAEPMYSVFLHVIARADALRYPDPHRLLADVRSGIRDIDPNLAVYRARTMEEQVYKPAEGPRFRAVLLGGFALLAVILAAVGLYGVISQAVVQQTREIGIRMAIGAMPGDVQRMVVRRGLTLAIAGVAFGICGSLMLSRLLASLLYGVNATNPLMLAAVSVIMLVVAVLASWLPARRATRIDPVQTLRHE
ncbi:MAG: ABC transporter permease [Bryobacteraceae bacterium]